MSPFFIPGRLINLAAGYASIEFGASKNNHAVVTACSTGAHAIGDAAAAVGLGDAEVMVAGGCESQIESPPLGDCRLCGVRARFPPASTIPLNAPRNLDKDRDGFVMGEGAGIVIFEEYQHAKEARRANLRGTRRLWSLR